MSKPIVVSKDAPMSPNICCRCRVHAGIRDYMVDLGVDFQYEGTMYFCNMCMRDVVNLLPDAVLINKLEEIEQDHMHQLMELQDEIKAARTLEKRLDELGIRVALPEIIEVDEDAARIDGQVSSESDGDEPTVIEPDSETAGDNREAIFTGMGAITFG